LQHVRILDELRDKYNWIEQQKADVTRMEERYFMTGSGNQRGIRGK